MADNITVKDAAAANVVVASKDVASVQFPKHIIYDSAGVEVPLSVGLGAVTEAAPASDTASSGLNGRLQRIAQRLTSLIALIPTALGQGTMAQSLRVVLPSDQSALSTVGPSAHDAAISGAPNRTAGRALTANYTAVATGDTADFVSTLVGAQIVKPFSIPEADWSYAAAASGIANTTTAVTIKAAAAAGLRNYITGIDLATDGALGAATEVAIRDGAGGTVIWRMKIGTAGMQAGRAITFPTPIKGTAATLLEVVTLTASVTGAVYFNATGYIAP